MRLNLEERGDMKEKQQGNKVWKGNVDSIGKIIKWRPNQWRWNYDAKGCVRWSERGRVGGWGVTNSSQVWQ